MRMTEMAAVSANAFLLLCCCFFSSTVSEDVYAAVGDSVTLSLKTKPGPTDTVNWSLNGTRLVSWRAGRVGIGNKEDIDKNLSLIRRNLKKGTVGPYKAEIYSKEGKLQRTDSFTLHVLGKVPKPEVKFTCQKSMVTFKCQVNPQAEGLKFQWLGVETLKESRQTLIRKDDQLPEGHSFQCNVSNQVSYEISKPATASCSKASPENSENLLFGFDFWTMVGILAGGGGLVLLLIIITVVCCTRAKRQRHNRLKEEEELRLEWTSQQQQQQHLHPHQHQHQPAGHTGPRQHRSKPPRNPDRPRGPDDTCTHPRHPRPSPRVPEHGPRQGCKGDEEQPPPLPQPRKKGPKTPRARHEVHA